MSTGFLTPIDKPLKPFGRGPTTLLRELTITMVINHVSEFWDDPPSRGTRMSQEVSKWLVNGL